MVTISRVIDHFLRLRPARPHHRNIHGRAWRSGQRAANLWQRHIPRALAFDRFEDVRILDSSLLRGRSRQHRNHVRVSKALGDGRSDLALGFRLVSLVGLIGGSRQVAGVRIERLHQAHAARRPSPWGCSDLPRTRSARATRLRYRPASAGRSRRPRRHVRPQSEPTTTNNNTAKDETRIAALIFMDIGFFVLERSQFLTNFYLIISCRCRFLSAGCPVPIPVRNLAGIRHASTQFRTRIKTIQRQFRHPAAMLAV